MEGCRHFLSCYLVLTLICLFVDFIDFIIQFVRFGRKGDEYSDLMMLFIVIVFLALDVFYFIWAFQVRKKFSSDISLFIT